MALASFLRGDNRNQIRNSDMTDTTDNPASGFEQGMTRMVRDINERHRAEHQKAQEKADQARQEREQEREKQATRARIQEIERANIREAQEPTTPNYIFPEFHRDNSDSESGQSGEFIDRAILPDAILEFYAVADQSRKLGVRIRVVRKKI